MNLITVPADAPAAEIDERDEDGLLVLSPANRRSSRRVLFVNVSGGPARWHDYKRGLLPSNRLWGVIELVERGYEVAIVDALSDFYLHHNALPHDLRLVRRCVAWLRSGDLVYCAHNTLYWLPLLRRVGCLRRAIVSLLYAREPLNQARGHDGVIALTPAAEQQARRLAPRAKSARLAWGMDLEFLPHLPYSPGWFLSCGRTNRDVETLRRVSWTSAAPIRLIAHHSESLGDWPANVDVLPGGAGWESRIPYHELLHEQYSRCTASVVILKSDPVECTACGFTSLLEALAMGRPVIMTKTNAVPGEIDIERAGCGLWVPPGDSAALHRAMSQLAADPGRARQMGEKGRELCRTYYNMQRFGADLHQFFESL